MRMSEFCCDDPACACAPFRGRSSRQSCLAMLGAIIEHAAGDARGLAVFVLGRGGAPGDPRDAARPHPDDPDIADVLRRLRSASPVLHRLLHGERGEFIVIAQGLLDGGAVLSAAARLVQAFDDARQGSAVPSPDDVSVGIAFAPQHGARAEPLLAAAEAGLRYAMQAARGGKRKRPPSTSALGEPR
jgi:predicted signal transduction protein with EAL and GGDEF domain